MTVTSMLEGIGDKSEIAEIVQKLTIIYQESGHLRDAIKALEFVVNLWKRLNEPEEKKCEIFQFPAPKTKSKANRRR